ncbi:hypothetical protein [Stackebrandtia nassauensis]|uniref:Polyketide cyclase/dehydrase n=1 Tax=Stackebrandtia nassauensis (strain DSM 44728 / CIP 108903 / NRRL B-16338 / NBRC 102104 / LLR-40K-21) TaxID=446470 RepID=D3Q7Q7_STANL|nr:hypothetical protein [Stackebrandtia nassauensis]ADD44399.1 hypothetical protein Snas_4757 [Stackebrandtia nassauensis DSM 44728]
MKPKFEATAILELPLAQAEAAILDVRTGPPGQGHVWLLGDTTGAVTGGPQRFTAMLGNYRLTVDVDRERRTIATQGGWWYRGEYALEPAGPHTRVTHRVYNVAGPATRWGVPLANRLFIGFQAQTRASFADTVRDMGKRLGCRVSLPDPVAT